MEDDDVIDCDECDNTGVCPYCAGDDPKMTECEDCGGSGICSDCDGY
jgi:hypothetical protein